jgi:SnoaL-like domain
VPARESQGYEGTRMIVEIEQLFNRYANAVGSLKFDEWVSQFIEEGVLNNKGDAIRGHVALREFIAARYASGSPFKLIWFNPVITVRGTEANSECDFIRAEINLGGNNGVDLQVTGVGKYIDDLVYENRLWKIRERRIVPHGSL